MKKLFSWWESIIRAFEALLKAGIKPVDAASPAITYLYNPGKPDGIPQEGTYESASGGSKAQPGHPNCVALIGDVVTIGGTNFGAQPGNKGYVTLRDSGGTVFGGAIPDANGEEPGQNSLFLVGTATEPDGNTVTLPSPPWSTTLIAFKIPGEAFEGHAKVTVTAGGSTSAPEELEISFGA
jgi:hypothetical protein